MHDNVGARDCAIRIFLGFGIIAAALVLGEGHVRWLAFLGALPVTSAVFGYCPAYALLGVSTVKQYPEYSSRRSAHLAR